MSRQTHAEFGRRVRKALRGQRLKPRRLYDRGSFGSGYRESDNDWFENNHDALVALLECLTGEPR